MRILFTADHEEGNIFASFGLAKQLKARQHKVTYVGISDAEELVRRENLDFIPILEDVYPSGTKYSTARVTELSESRDALCSLFFDQRVAFDQLIAHIDPRLIIVPPYMAMESLLLQLRYQVPIVHLRSAYYVKPRLETIREECVEVLDHSSYGAAVKELLRSSELGTADLDVAVECVAQMPELVTLPPDYERYHAEPVLNTHYIGAMVDLTRNESRFDWQMVPPAKKLIFCSLGSQCDRDRAKSKSFFEQLLQTVRDRHDWFLIMSIGKGMSRVDFELPPNVLLTNWAPQLEVLSRADMMIMHGGMGTTRECILNQVPMLAFPLMRDQFTSAEAIALHGLGLHGDMEALTTSLLSTQIDTVLSDASLRNNLAAKRGRFVACESDQLGVAIAENASRVINSQTAS